MGTSAYTNFGPYIAVKPLMHDHEINLWGCINGKCRYFQKEQKDKFCPGCGKETAHYKNIEKRKFSFRNFLSDPKMNKKWEDDCFYHPEYVKIGDKEVYFENSRPNFAPEKNRVNISESKMQDIDFENITKEKTWFESHYAELIKEIIEIFGAENVKIGYGVISYWS